MTARLADLTVGINIVGHRLMLNFDRNIEQESNASPESNACEEPYKDIACQRARDRASGTGWCVIELTILPDQDAYGRTDGAVNIRSNMTFIIPLY